MSNSKYPEKIDTSVEIPTVRDNITEISSDVLNSYKSAIIAIEKTLGINPQGIAGNTVANRISQALDENGNIKKEAIVKSGILSGPIINKDVSDSAAIAESKLKLNFPTSLLQSEISILDSQINDLITAIDAIGTKFAAHISPDALGRHNAISINVNSSITPRSDLSLQDLEKKDLQSTVEDLFSRHIKYTGEFISENNNSHSANQIYFDNSDVQNIIISNNVQDAIEDISNINNIALKNALLNLNSNGLLRRGSVFDKKNQPRSKLLLEQTIVNYNKSPGSTKTTINLLTPAIINNEINQFDIVLLSGFLNEDDNKEYLISDIILDINENLVSIEVYGGPTSIFLGNILAEVYKNPYTAYNVAGLLTAVRPRQNKSNTPDIQVANPNSASVISFGCRPNEITATENSFVIRIDDNQEYEINVYDSTITEQTIDSIINKINEYIVDFNLNMLAYKYKSLECYEIALVHNLPNLSEQILRTLEVKTSPTNDATSILGFSSALGVKHEGTSGNSIFINGIVKDLSNDVDVLTFSDIEIISGTNTLRLFNNNFSDYKLRVGDIIYIENADLSVDDGAYRVSSYIDDTVILEKNGTFSGFLNQESRIFLIKTGVNIGELTFEEVSLSTGSILFDIFLTEDTSLFYKKRMEISGTLITSNFFAGVYNVSKNFIKKNETAVISITPTGIAQLQDPSGNLGPAIFVGETGDYKLFSADEFSFVEIRVLATGVPGSNMTAILYGNSEVSSSSYLLSRGLFSTTLGRVLGYPSESGIPVLLDKRITGVVDSSVISNTFIEKYIEGPRHELRGDGIVRGLSVSNLRNMGSYNLIDISPGVCYVNGIRKEISGKVDLVIPNLNVYVGIDGNGCILVEEEDANGNSTLLSRPIAHIAYISNEIFDLRYFISQVDNKISKEILVSKERQLGHFTDISSAVRFAKKYKNIYRESLTPKVHIRSGEYSVNAPIIIDFDLEITGDGPNTVITKSGSFAAGSALISGNPSPVDTLFYIGNIATNVSSEINRGISISNLTYKVSNGLVNIGSFISIGEKIDLTSSEQKRFLFTNLNFVGNITMSTTVGEYFMIIGFADPLTFLPLDDTYGNITISNCSYTYSGLEYGPVLLRDTVSNIFDGIIATQNMGRKLSPNVLDTSFDVFVVNINATLLNIIEANNVTVIS